FSAMEVKSRVEKSRRREVESGESTVTHSLVFDCHLLAVKCPLVSTVNFRLSTLDFSTALQISNMRSSATRAQRLVSESTATWFTTSPSTRLSSVQQRCWGEIR